MRVAEATVSNYRSIGNQTKFSLSEFTTLIGPNNEGKSNLLRALALGLRVIDTWSTLPDEIARKGELTGRQTTLIYESYAPGRRADRIRDIDYEWLTDYPLGKQTAKSIRPTIIRITFALSDEERADFKDGTGLSNNGELPIELRFSRTATSLHVIKQGPGSSAYKHKAGEIARFVSERISYVLIPAVRTMDQAMNLLNELASIRLSELARSEDYKNALSEVNHLRSAAVHGVQKDLQRSIATYLPGVSDVTVETRDIRQTSAINRVIIDDGSATSLDQKGDGVKSLFALALIQHLARERTSEYGDNLILLVDEPEAHLHSRAVHDLQTLFTRISRTQQVVLATHNPIFVNRERVNSNILVQQNSASAAGSVKRVRDTLGIEPQDNLDSAEVVVLTEGVTDAKIIPVGLRSISSAVSRDLQTGRVIFKSVRGSGKMRSHVIQERSSACRIIAVLDNDQAGRAEAERLHEEGILDQKSIFILRRTGMKSSEIEDLLLCEVYLEALKEAFGRNFSSTHFSNASKRWSENFLSAADTLALSGASDENAKTAKIAVSDAVETYAGMPFRTEARDGLQALYDAIWLDEKA